MAQTLLAYFSYFPPELATLLVAMFPFVDRVALPVAVAVFKIPAWQAFVLSVLGNLVPVVLILALADRCHYWIVKNSGFFGKAWARSVDHAQAAFLRYEKYGLIGLFLFVVIPSPVSGVYTASTLAFILGYPMKKSFPVIFFSVIVYNLLLYAATFGLVKIF